MAHIVLIHGSWHAGWCWEIVEPLLTARGHVVHALDLPGMTQPEDDQLAGESIESWAVWLEDFLRSLPCRAVLVGHSRGGAVISRTAERVPTLVERLIYVAGLLVEDMQSCSELYSSMPPPQAVLDHPNMIRVTEDGTSTLDGAGALSCMYQRTPLDLAVRAVERLGREPHWVLSEKIAISAARFGSVPRAYIETTRDAVLSIHLQRRMVQNLPCSPVVTLESDHSPFFSAPQALVDAISGIIEGASDTTTGGPQGGSAAHVTDVAELRRTSASAS